MKYICRTLLAAFVLFGLALAAGSQLNSPPRAFTELFRVDVADTDDLEVVMGVIERNGRSSGGRHIHPRGEFGFILEGAVTVETEGSEPQTLQAGASFHQPAGEWHAVSTGADGTRTVVFRVVKKGDPMIVSVDTES